MELQPQQQQHTTADSASVYIPKRQRSAAAKKSNGHNGSKKSNGGNGKHFHLLQQHPSVNVKTHAKTVRGAVDRLLRAPTLNVSKPENPKLWIKGETGNPTGRPTSARELVTKASVRIMARTGMLPLDFMTAVYRNALYEDYDQQVAEDGRTLYFTPKPGAERVLCGLETRLSAAIACAHYVHKRMPVGIELGERGAVGLTAERLKRLSSQELDEMMRILDKIGVDLTLGAAAPGTVVDESGRVLQLTG